MNIERLPAELNLFSRGVLAMPTIRPVAISATATDGLQGRRTRFNNAAHRPRTSAAGGLPLSISSLRKEYADITALADVTFQVHPGEIVGLLGRNGAGKSTLIKCVLGFVSPTVGSISVFGLSPREAVSRGCIGYCSQDIALYPGASVETNLRFFAGLYRSNGADVSKIVRTALEELHLRTVARRPAGRLSGGYSRRVHLAATIVTGAPLLLLDEPTVGADMHSRDRIRQLIRQLGGSGTAILVTSHDLRDIEALADRVIIIGDGRLVAGGTIDELASHFNGLARLSFTSRAERDSAAAHLAPRYRVKTMADNALNIPLSTGQPPGDLLRDLGDWSARCRVEILPPGLEAVFVEATSRPLAVD